MRFTVGMYDIVELIDNGSSVSAQCSKALSIVSVLKKLSYHSFSASAGAPSLILVKCIGERSFSYEPVFKIVKAVIIKRFFPNLRNQAILVFLPQMAAMLLRLKGKIQEPVHFKKGAVGVIHHRRAENEVYTLLFA